MFVSVVIPTYNRQEQVLQAINSVLSQSHADLEVVVVDDGSTDHTGSVLQQINDARLKILQSTHQGVAAARNKGIAVAKGELIALLDSDDFWLPAKLQEHLVFHLKGGWEISQCDELWERGGRLVNPHYKHKKKAGWIFAPSLERCLVSPSAVIFSKRLWQYVGPFDQDLLACEDYDLWLKVSLVYPVGFLPKKLVVKRGGHSDQLSRKVIGLDLYRIYSLINLLKQKDLDRGKRVLVEKNLKERVKRYTQGCLKRDKPEEAERLLSLCQGVLFKE